MDIHHVWYLPKAQIIVKEILTLNIKQRDEVIRQTPIVWAKNMMKDAILKISEKGVRGLGILYSFNHAIAS